MLDKETIGYTPNVKRASNIEIVERKGIGHPDTLADGLAASASYSYSRFCYDRYGVVLHHRFDKTMVIGGQSRVDFGLGEIVKPIDVLYVGKASDSFAGEKVPWEEILMDSTSRYFGISLPAIRKENVNVGFKVSTSSRNPYWFRPRDIYDIPDAHNPAANDTSITFGQWPLTETESLVLQLERSLYHPGWVSRFDFLGRDIKILAVRSGEHVDLTMCVPFLGQKTPNEDFYYEKKGILKTDLEGLAREISQDKFRVTIAINSEDHIYNTKTEIRQKGHYLLVTGSALDHGEEGVVGRGNKSNGLISSYRPYSMEAPYGKNPAYYTGVIYNYVAEKLAQGIGQTFNTETTIALVSQNGNPLNRPAKVLIETYDNIATNDLYAFVDNEFDRNNWTEEILKEEPFVPIKWS